MKVKLSDIASIQMGFSFRGKIVPDAHGNTHVIQMKDLSGDNLLSTEDLVSIKLGVIKEPYQIKQNDIVFRSRGHTNTAAFIQYPVEDALLAAPLIRIRVTDNNILPAYLCWLINQQEMQIKIQRLAQGTSVKMIEKQELDELDITIPSLKKQKKILELDQLLNREQNLMKKLSERKSQLIKGYMLRIATNSQ